MATVIIMPKQGQSVESCVIAKWHKKKNDSVNVGDILFTYETDKATFDEEAKTAGVMLDIFFEEGDDVPCLTNVCVIGENGEDAAQFAPAGEAPAGETAAPEAITEEAPQHQAPQTVEEKTDREKISPRARLLAEKTGVMPSLAKPTGPSGRIIERDIRALAEIDAEGVTPPAKEPKAAPVPAAEVTQVPVSNIRKVIARSMHESLSTMAQLTLNSSFDASEIIAYRARIKANGEKLGLANITLNDIVLYAVSRVLPAHKDLNAHFYGDRILHFNSVNLGMAVDTPRGLMVPTIFGASEKSLNDIAIEAKRLSGMAQGGTINPDLLTGGTFTVTNLGALGVESFTPVINPPQTAILGVDTITTGVREVGGEIKAYSKMGLSLTFDHRAVDGAPAARLLQDICFALENFSVFLSR